MMRVKAETTNIGIINLCQNEGKSDMVVVDDSAADTRGLTPDDVAARLFEKTIIPLVWSTPGIT
jgi:hypothetical protein